MSTNAASYGQPAPAGDAKPSSARATMIDHPAHYQTAVGIEAIDVIEAAVGIEGHVANAIKYILRHRKKGRPAEDLEKALWYVLRLEGSGCRIRRENAISVVAASEAVAAFEIDGPAARALLHLFDLVIAQSDRAYRARLRKVAVALDEAIADLQRTAP